MADRPKLDSRLKEVHQSDLTEGRINQDFVDWLKTKGVNYLLVVLVALCAYLGWVRWSHHQRSYQAEAWRELNSAQGLLPSSLEDVAQKYGDVGSVAHLARLDAAAKLLASIQTGKSLGLGATEPTDPNAPSTAPVRPLLTPEERDRNLARADALYAQVASETGDDTGRLLLTVTALTGRAAVAESQGKIEEARGFYEQAAKRAEPVYPELAALSRRRAEQSSKAQTPSALPTLAEVQAANVASPAPTTPANVEGWLRQIILEEGGAG